MKTYVHCVVLAGLLTSGCQRDTGTPATEGSSDRQTGAIEIPAGTQFWVRVDQTIDSSKAKQGDLIKGVLNTSIVAGGREVLPLGTDLGVRITNAKVADQAGSVGLLTLDVETIRHGGNEYRLDAAPVTVETAPVKQGVEPGRQLPNLPLTEGQGRANAVLEPNRPLLFISDAPVFVKP